MYNSVRLSSLDQETNMSKVQDFTNGNVWKLILGFYFPMLCTNMLQQFYNFVDAALVGKGLGDAALAAVGNMGSLTFLIIGFTFGIGIGFSIMVAQAFGSKDYEELRRYLASSITLSVIIAVTMTILSLVFLRPALDLLQTDASILPQSLLYGYIIFGGLSCTMMYNISSAILRALGDSKVPLQAIIVSSLLNIVLDALCIFVLHTGVEGAAAATIFSQFVAGAICIKKLSGIEILHLTSSDFRGNGERYRVLLTNGIPMGIMNSITAIGCMALQFFVNGLGVFYTSAYSATSRYINLFMQPACTAGHATSAYTSQNYGAGRWDRIREGLRITGGISILCYVLLAPVLIFAARPLAMVFLSGEDSIALAAQYLPISGLFMIMVNLLFVVRSAVQGMGYPMVPMISGVAEMALRMITVILLIDVFGFRAIAYAEVAAWTGALVLNLGQLIRLMAVNSHKAHSSKGKEKLIYG